MPPTPAHKDEWKLVWADEFDYTGEPDDSKWTREEGFLRNAELQLYTPAGAFPPSFFRCICSPPLLYSSPASFRFISLCEF